MAAPEARPVVASSSAPPADAIDSGRAEPVSPGPRSLAGLFDDALDVYRQHAVPLLLMFAITVLPVQVGLQFAELRWLAPLAARLRASAGAPDAGTILEAVAGYAFVGMPAYGVPGVALLCSLAIAAGAVAAGVAAAIRGGRVPVRTSLRLAVRSAPRLVAGWMVAGLASFGVAAGVGSALLFFLAIVAGSILAAIGGGGAAAGNNAVGVAIVVIPIVGAVLALTGIAARFFVFAAPVIVVEGRSAWQMPTRTARLTSGQCYGRAWTVTFGAPVITFGLEFLALLAVGSTLAAMRLNAVVHFAASTAIATAITVLMQPYWMVLLTLAYFDCRCRLEGYDVRLLWEGAGR